MAGLVATATTDGDFGLARYNRDGSLDASFGDGGRVTTDFFNDSDESSGLAIQPDGKVVVAGTAFGADTPFGLIDSFVLAR